MNNPTRPSPSAPTADLAALRRFLASDRRPVAVDANPMAQALGMQLLDADAATGRVRLGFEPAAYFIQGTGVLQGGAVAGMLDFAMAFATMATLGEGEGCATVSLNTSFLKGAPSGRYVAEGELERRGRRMAFARATLAAADTPDTLVATASSVLTITGG